MRFLQPLVALCLLLLPCLPARSAPDEEFDPRDQRRLFAVRDTNAARHAIEEARGALERGQVVRGLTSAQRVLDSMTDDFYLQEEASSAASVLWRSAPEVVREMLAGLPAAQREVYERMAAPSAAPLLADSLRRRDESGLREVLRRYGPSRAGGRAARLLAALAGESGRWRDAARYLREGLRYAPRDVGLWVPLFDALAAAGDRRTLASLAPPADLEAKRGDARKPLTVLRDEALAGMPRPEGFAGWPMWGGVPGRDAHLPHEPPMPHQLRWREATDWTERLADRERAFFGRSTGSHVFREMLGTVRSVHPVLDGRTLYVSDGRTVRAYDMLSGRRAWAFDAEHNTSGLELVPTGVGAGRTSLQRAFSPVVAGDAVIATIEVARPYDPETLQGVEISTYLPRRVLVALDKASGRARWWMGREGVDRLSLSETTIISPPVVAEGLVLVVGSYHDGNHNLSFLAFDLETGALRWQRPLGFGQQELNLFGAPLKEPAASPVAVADGVAYASTGLGFVAAVDIRSGVPRWLASYDIIRVEKVELWYDAPVRSPRVAPAPPVVRGDVLVVCPTDGTHVHAFDRRTGTLLWRERYDTRGMVYDVTGHFLGVAHDGQRDVVLLTDKELCARDLDTGEIVWRGRFDPEGDRVIGRGAVAGEEILVPTREGLQRFALRSEGAYRGTVPWPQDADPGNLLPLSRVLIVSGREELQWFYDWAAIERDVQRRRAERPDDASILLEAGEMYLRGGGETERARKAFREAREVARRAQPELEPRAVEGLYATWLMEGDQHAAFPERARTAWSKALEFAQTPEQRVIVRMRLHRLFTARDPDAAVENLQRLVNEAGNALAVVDAAQGRVPARATALFLLAEAWLEREQPARAVDVLQRVLHEERETPLPDGSAGEQAQAAVAEILDRYGAEVYAPHEEKARALLRASRKTGDPQLLDRILLEYPNAAAVADALLDRARAEAQAERPLGAARHLRRLLRGARADHPLRPLALAVLADAYRSAGARGAARAALMRLEGRHAAARFAWRGAEVTAADFAARERQALDAARYTAPADPGLAAPLRERAFLPAGDEEYARSVDVAVDPDSADRVRSAPVALMMRGQELVVVDLLRGAQAWQEMVGSLQRAAWAEGVLVLAVSRELRGYDALSGEELWRVPTDASARDLQVGGGLVYALVQDVVGASRGNRVLALDVHRGVEVWRAPLQRSDYRDLMPQGGRVLLRQVRYERTGVRGELLVFDAFDGRRLRSLQVPLQVDTRPLVHGDLWCVGGTLGTRNQRVLAAYDMQRGRLAWSRVLPGRHMVGGIALHEDELVVLQQDGSLGSYRASDGEPLQQTRVYVGEGGNARPFPSTPLMVDAERVVFMPWVRQPSLSLVCYDRRTGKLQWESPYPPGLSLSRATLIESGDVIAAMVAYRRGDAQRILLRLVQRADGKLLQAIEPEDLSRDNYPPSMQVGYGTMVVFGRSGCSVLRPESAR